MQTHRHAYGSYFTHTHIHTHTHRGWDLSIKNKAVKENKRKRQSNLWKVIADGYVARNDGAKTQRRLTLTQREREREREREKQHRDTGRQRHKGRNGLQDLSKYHL